MDGARAVALAFLEGVDAVEPDAPGPRHRALKSGSGAMWPLAFHSLQAVAQAWQPTQMSRSMTRPSCFWPGCGRAGWSCAPAPRDCRRPAP